MVKIFVGQLSLSDKDGRCVTSKQLLPLFQDFGEVTECTVLSEKGYGFVHMTSEKAAQKAVKRLNGNIIQGKRISVEFSHDIGKTSSGEIQLTDCFNYQTSKNCKTGNKCAYLHRSLPRDICVYYIFQKCVARGENKCSGKHVSLSDLPPPPNNEIKRIQRLGLKADQINEYYGSEANHQKKPLKIAINTRQPDLKTCHRPMSELVCLDCQFTAGSSTKLEKHLNTDQHWNTLKKMTKDNLNVIGVVDKVDIWCKECRLWVSQTNWRDHVKQRVHQAMEVAVEVLNKLVGQQKVECQLCGIETTDLSGEIFRDHIYSKTHRERLVEWLDEEEWITVGQKISRGADNLNPFIVTGVGYEDLWPDLHVYYIPKSVTARRFNDICSKFGVLTKFQMFPMSDGSSRSKKYDQAYLNYSNVGSVKVATDELTKLWKEDTDQQMIVVETNSKQDKHIRTGGGSGRRSDIDFLLHRTKMNRSEDMMSYSEPKVFQCNECPVVCNSAKQTELHIIQKHGSRGSVKGKSKESMVKVETNNRFKGMDYKDKSAVNSQIQVLSEQLQMVSFQRKEREEFLIKCQQDIQVVEAEGDIPEQLRLLQQELQIHRGLRELDSVTRSLRQQMTKCRSDQEGDSVTRTLSQHNMTECRPDREVDSLAYWSLHHGQQMSEHDLDSVTSSLRQPMSDCKSDQEKDDSLYRTLCQPKSECNRSDIVDNSLIFKIKYPWGKLETCDNATTTFNGFKVLEDANLDKIFNSDEED